METRKRFFKNGPLQFFSVFSNLFHQRRNFPLLWHYQKVHLTLPRVNEQMRIRKKKWKGVNLIGKSALMEPQQNVTLIALISASVVGIYYCSYINAVLRFL